MKGNLKHHDLLIINPLIRSYFLGQGWHWGGSLNFSSFKFIRSPPVKAFIRETSSKKKGAQLIKRVDFFDHCDIASTRFFWGHERLPHHLQNHSDKHFLDTNLTTTPWEKSATFHAKKWHRVNKLITLQQWVGTCSLIPCEKVSLLRVVSSDEEKERGWKTLLVWIFLGGEFWWNATSIWLLTIQNEQMSSKKMINPTDSVCDFSWYLDVMHFYKVAPCFRLQNHEQ